MDISPTPSFLFVHVVFECLLSTVCIFFRYNDTIVKGICNRLERTKPNALEEFVKLCIPLFASDQDFLFGKLIDCVSNDPEKVEDVWVSMQEANFIPNDSLLRKLAGNLKSHGLDVPFQVEDEPEISAPSEILLSKIGY